MILSLFLTDEEIVNLGLVVCSQNKTEQINNNPLYKSEKDKLSEEDLEKAKDLYYINQIIIKDVKVKMIQFSFLIQNVKKMVVNYLLLKEHFMKIQMWNM